MTNRIDASFASLRAAGRKGLVAYITAGDPSLDKTVDLVLALEDAGADIVELGIPFSDPLADGIVNQMAAHRALVAGATVPKLMETIAAIRQRSQIPIVLFTYLNPVFQYGFEAFHKDGAAAGADGLLLLDLPPEEEEANAELSGSAGLAHVRLIAPTTPGERIARITAKASGFIYYVSREGVTGEQQKLADSIGDRVAAIKSTTEVPVAVGFGISTPEQAAEVASLADAVVVGSAIVRRIADNGGDPALPGIVADFVRPLARAVHGG